MIFAPYLRSACCFFATLWLSAEAAVAAPVDIEGTWRIAKPEVSLHPIGGAIPFTPKGRKQYEQNRRYRAAGDYDAYDYLASRCASPGLPRLMLTPDRFRIWQRTGLTMFLFEANRLFRQIDMGGLPERPAIEGPGGRGNDAFVGRAVPISKGKWEGDILVARTDGFEQGSVTTLLDDLLPHGEKLRTIERIRLLNRATLEDRITIEDPEYFTRPWQAMITYKRQPDLPFAENVCLDTLRARSRAPQASRRSATDGDGR